MPESKRRRRRRGPAQVEGSRKSRLPFPINLIFNVKSFYIIFIVVMIASMASIGFAQNTGTRPEGPPIIDITNTPEATPQAKTFASPGPVMATSIPTEHFKATLSTNKGDIVIDLATDTPQAVNSFKFLEAKNFFDGQALFYLDQNYWAQAGDPACNPELDQICTGTGDAGYRLPVEVGALKHVKWAVVAPSVQGTENLVSGGQFRILFADDERLDGTETVFGMVVEGRDILENASRFHLCSALTRESEGCQRDFADAIIIENVSVEPAG